MHPAEPGTVFESFWTMPNRFHKMDLGTLQQLYERRSAELETSLLKGIGWKQVTYLQKTIRRISMLIYQKLNPSA
ncbi:MAG TPA: hypothetical protein VFZ78_03370 [Flavisolibacter sp.]